jgi:hypothetical protein
LMRGRRRGFFEMQFMGFEEKVLSVARQYLELVGTNGAR